MYPLFRRINFILSDGRMESDDLPVEIRQADRIMIDQVQCTNASTT